MWMSQKPLTPYFYPRPPRGGRPGRVPHAAEHRPISIHALREEGDLTSASLHCACPIFLSTPSARRATGSEHDPDPLHPISIHALREEGDLPRLPEKPYMEISIHALREEGDKTDTTIL